MESPSVRFSKVNIYPVTGRSLFAGRTDEDVIAALAEGGAKIIQLREKNVTDGELYELATLYRKVTARHSMLLIINDRADIALAVGADGVHVGSGDMPVAAVRRVMGDDAIIGASSHNVETAIMAEKCGATYVNIGPLYPTPTKPSAVAIGLAPVKAALLKVSAPVSVMGGIVMDNIDDVLAVGVRHIGVVTALFGEKDIAGATRRLVTKIEGARVV